MKKNIILITLIFLIFFACGRKTQFPAQPKTPKVQTKNEPINTEIDTILQVGAEQLDLYLPDLQGKRVGMVVNHTSLVGKTHLVDTLLKYQIQLKKIFAPEHGFRGEADAGEKIINSTDPKTGIPLVSLYGKNKKPSAEQLADIEVVIFDMQDVGTRFFTYISTMHYVMEAAAENDKKVIILDRPNPNGHLIDGSMLVPKFKSFVGMHNIPLLHGLTIAELANMINGEGWLAGGMKCKLKTVPNKNYKHHKSYILPVRPSPNLPNQQAVLLYPSVCLLEGTVLSVGRGTDFPFQVIGGNNPVYGSFTFTPKSAFGARKPLLENQTCFGIDLRNESTNGFTLKYLIDFYQKSPDKANFFNSYFDTLVGTDVLKKQIIAGMTEEQIRQTWQTDLEKYKTLRKKYLLYE
ncbi:MAG: DUF1343 domain-containing protein [Verrucomicrobia bacterium]|nr:DUF1343 domain-containing protein [Cytophagales bacterium]